MNSRLVLLLSALFALTACTGQETPAPAAAEPASVPATSAAPAAPTAEAAPDIQPAAAATPPQGPAPVVGTDYIEIPGGQPFTPAPGKIEVVEVFSYTCPHCAAFEPQIEIWRGKQTADVNFVPVAGPFAGNPMPFTKAFYAAESLGLASKTHAALFRAIHVDRSLDFMRADSASIAKFYAQYGADPAQFASTMDSFFVDARVKRAIAFIQHSGVDSSPALIVNGKYRVTGKSLEENLRIADHLVARERAAQAH